MRILKPSLALFLCLALMTSCGSRKITRPGAPDKPVTTFERVLIWNASIAEVNLAIAKAVISAQEAGNISVERANAILLGQSRIADSNRQLSFIFQKGEAVIADERDAVQELLEQIKTAADNLIKSGTLGIKDPKTQQAVSTNLRAIVDLITQISSTLRPLWKMGPAPAG